jgi:hypothetical protein
MPINLRPRIAPPKKEKIFGGAKPNEGRNVAPGKTLVADPFDAHAATGRDSHEHAENRHQSQLGRFIAATLFQEEL